MNVIPGIPELRDRMAEPHAGQKPRLIMLPLSAGRA